MRRNNLFCNVIIVMTVSSPALASGHHISCQLNGGVQQKTDKHQVSRTLNFYLDDTGETLVPENGGISARTTLYADTEIKAEISDISLGGGNLFLFGAVIMPPALLQIDRKNGSATIMAKLAPAGAGADVEVGACQEISPAPTKF